MLRRGWCLPTVPAAVPTVLLAGLLAAGCGDDGEADPGPPTTAGDRPPPTLPARVDPGRGALVLGDAAVVVTVTDCRLDPSTDGATGVTTELAVTAEDGTGLAVDVSRSSFTGDLTTVTDAVRITDEDGEVLEASRAERSGTWIDLRQPGASGPLLAVEGGGTVRASGVFGPPGSTEGDPANVAGELLLRCP